jgi:hypothetical protein
MGPDSAPGDGRFAGRPEVVEGFAAGEKFADIAAPTDTALSVDLASPADFAEP